MFYNGSLQEGISTAVGQQKLVFCFVTDGNEESLTWENEFLKEQALLELINTQAVALRLQAGSEEAGYLAQIFPLPQTPTVVIIKNGELKEYITPGVTKDDFVRRIQTAFRAPQSTMQTNNTATTTTTTTPSSSSTTSQAPPTYAASQEQSQRQPQRERTGVEAAVPAERSETVQRVLAERAARLQAQKEEAERKAREDRAKAQDKAKTEAEAGVDTDAAKAYKQAELVKKKKQRDRDERDRILKRIEDDKAERRQKAAERERRRLDHQSQKIGDAAAALVNAPETKLPSTTRRSDLTSLQVRLFDGSTMRTRFKTTAPLSDVRRWVDEKRGDGSLPYLFKQVLTPLPNRNIDTTEESKDLGDLNLAPSSTLVLVPLSASVNAYPADNGPGSLFSRLLRTILGFLAVILGLFGLGGAGGAGGDGRAERTGPGGSQGDQGTATSRGDRVQGLHDLNRRRDQQLYNGNSLNFEPRPDEEGQ